jgi:periplasmic divalent cation tolerance protein
VILVYTTHKTTADANKIVKRLLEKQLIACANTFPTTSTYRWHGKIKIEREVVAILKTREQLWTSVHDEILAMHPYDTPCVLKIDADANNAFGMWLNRETALSAIGALHTASKPLKTKAKSRTTPKKK